MGLHHSIVGPDAEFVAGEAAAGRSFYDLAQDFEVSPHSVRRALERLAGGPVRSSWVRPSTRPLDLREVVADIPAPVAVEFLVSLLERKFPEADPARVGAVMRLGLTRQQAQIFQILADRPGHTFSRDTILDRLTLTLADAPMPKTLDVQICRLRKVLRARLKPVQVVTVAGLGFRLEVDPGFSISEFLGLD